MFVTNPTKRRKANSFAGIMIAFIFVFYYFELHFDGRGSNSKVIYSGPRAKVFGEAYVDVHTINTTQRRQWVVGKNMYSFVDLGVTHAEKIDHLMFEPKFTPTGKRIDLAFGSSALTHEEMLSASKYLHADAIQVQHATEQHTDDYINLSTSQKVAQSILPTDIGYGSPNPNLPWRVPPCNGFPAAPPLAPLPYEAGTLSAHSVYIIRALNELGLYYHLDAGTLLGSKRHGGMIPWDVDVDIVIPVRRNLHLFGSDFECNDFDDRAAELPFTRALEGSSVESLCGLSKRAFAAKYLFRILDGYFQGSGIRVKLKPEGKQAVLKFFTFCRGEITEEVNLPGGGYYDRKKRNGTMCELMRFDVFVDFNPHTGDGACTCPWYYTHALCPMDSHQVLVNNFGPTYMEPVKETDMIDTVDTHATASDSQPDGVEGVDSPPERYVPLLTYPQAQLEYERLGVHQFSWRNKSLPSANLLYHLEPLLKIKAILHERVQDRQRALVKAAKKRDTMNTVQQD